jgi:two-component sensor histidine kinase
MKAHADADLLRFRCRSRDRLKQHSPVAPGLTGEQIEEARLAALASYDILDTPAEQGFDDIVHLAREICATPVALVSLVAADRQWFKAKEGFDACETPIEQSVCAHALQSSDLLIIPDLALDPRTRGNTLVTEEPHIRFYAGAPLITAAGIIIGTLCVIDRVPRPHGLTTAQAENLQRLAGQVMTQLDLRRALKEQHEVEAQRQLLNAELSHRLKNTLAMVQAIANQTLRGVTEQDAVTAFKKRIIAIAAAHDVLLRESWAAADMRTVAKAALGIFDAPFRFDVSGPDLTIGPRATLSVSMLIHELATNALKYGALSVDGGRVSVAWHLEANSDATDVVLNWTETGGPPASEPARRGFGSRLIGMGLVGSGACEIHYLPAGLQARFSAPLDAMQQQ